MSKDTQVPITSDKDIVTARQQGRAVAIEAGFSLSEATLIATAISELARNIVSYANYGSITLKPTNGASGMRGLTIVASDSGPGIADISQAPLGVLLEAEAQERLHARGQAFPIRLAHNHRR